MSGKNLYDWGAKKTMEQYNAMLCGVLCGWMNLNWDLRASLFGQIRRLKIRIFQKCKTRSGVGPDCSMERAQPLQTKTLPDSVTRSIAASTARCRGCMRA